MKKNIRTLIIVGIILALATGTVFAQSGEAADPGLVAVGSLSASNLYLSYLVLGTVADGFVSGSYEQEMTRSIAQEVIFLNGNSKTALDELLAGTVMAPEDQDVVLGMMESYTVLDNMAQALINFVDDEEDNGAAFQVFRLEAWDRISLLLNL